MTFTRVLRDRVRNGEITCSVRIWISPRVKVGGRYEMEEGHIEIDSIRQIEYYDITPELARESGFPDVPELLQVAKHGKGQNVYVVRFHYIPPRRPRKTGSNAKATAPAPEGGGGGSRAGIDSGKSRRRRLADR